MRCYTAPPSWFPEVLSIVYCAAAQTYYMYYDNEPTRATQSWGGGEACARACNPVGLRSAGVAALAGDLAVGDVVFPIEV